MSDDVAAGPNWTSGFNLPVLRDYGIYFALIALIGYFSLRVPEFRTWDNAALIPCRCRSLALSRSA